MFLKRQQDEDIICQDSKKLLRFLFKVNTVTKDAAHRRSMQEG